MSKAIEIDDFRRANLVKLARHLWDSTPEAAFDMGTWASKNWDDPDSREDVAPNDVLNHCGTVCCALGRGVFAGIAPAEDCDDWYSYCHDNFFADPESLEAQWCFDCQWMRFDNSPRGAAKRILWLLLDGLPEKYWPSHSSMPYAVWTPTESDWQRAATPPASVPNTRQPACVPQGQGEGQ